jgi:hypothetical protein
MGTIIVVRKERSVDDPMLISLHSQVLRRIVRVVDMREMVVVFDTFDMILDCVSRGNEKDAGVQPDVRSRREQWLVEGIKSHGDRKDVQAEIEA